MSHSISSKNPKGAGRKSGSGPFGEPTKPVRLPVSLIPTVQEWLGEVRVARALPEGAVLPATDASPLAIPLFLEPVRAGFPSPAQGYEKGRIDLNEKLVSNPTATYYLEAEGDSMIDAGIGDGDLLVVDFSQEAKEGDIVIARLRDSFTVKRLRWRQGRPELHPESAGQNYPVIRPGEEEELVIVGVVKWVIKKV